MTRYLPLVAAALLAIGGAIYMTQNSGSLPGVSIAEAQEADASVDPAPDMALGDDAAPVTVVEYASFTCPHCANFHEDVFKKLKSEYVDSGKVKFIHREVYFDRYGLWAGMIARCGGDARYFGLIDLIYQGQEEWIADGTPATILENLKKIGRTTGMSNDEMDACLQNEEMAQSMVAAYQANAGADEITGTPSFIINGEKYSNMSYGDFAEILDEKLAE
ncbi:DsbA family protein [Aliiroseovarius marinus]|uniref:DsbA family protein n=1 Tax=Aliiroseovarius marinus TaxID=2500159 RepID=UPI003D7C8117